MPPLLRNAPVMVCVAASSVRLASSMLPERRRSRSMRSVAFVEPAVLAQFGEQFGIRPDVRHELLFERTLRREPARLAAELAQTLEVGAARAR
jgi:hypothetical protein